ncbi:MAG: hypothetical protein N3H31_06890, partial [Candidatus Nezhaarchaeota archaeon]|nr:hypothetical protein [Candidatus Nezhaarchaeota archaeon]
MKELLRQYGVKSYMSVLEYLVATRLPRITRLYRVLVLPNGLKILIPELEDYYKSIIASYGEVYIQGMYRRRREYLPR